MSEAPPIWESIARAVGAEYRPETTITGISGLEHSVQAIAVDDKDKRLILVSGEYNPRIAALMRVDVQATMPDIRVLVARPVTIDLSHMAMKLFMSAAGTLDLEKLAEFSELFTDANTNADIINEKYKDVAAAAMSSMTKSGLPPLSQIIQIVQQTAAIDWRSVFEGAQTGPDIVSNVVHSALTLDNLEGDRNHGVCAVPTYEFGEADWELFASGYDIEAVRQRLTELGIYQYFFPPADTLALGMIDRGKGAIADIQSGMEIATTSGHYIAPSALVGDARDLPDILAELKSQGFIAEGEFSYEMEQDGQKMRQTLKVRPAEGLLSKIVSRFNVNLSASPKDFLG